MERGIASVGVAKERGLLRCDGRPAASGGRLRRPPGIVTFEGEGLGREFFFGPERAIAEDVLDLARVSATFDEHAGDEQVAMAGQGVGFGAEEREAVAGGAQFDGFDRSEELGRMGEGAVEHVAGAVVEAAVDGPPAEFVAHEGVADLVRERPPQRVAVELRRKAAHRLAADVDQDFDIVLAEKLDEPGELVVGVADGEERLGHGKAILRRRIEGRTVTDETFTLCTRPVVVDRG
jgi:hypothetical protein